jgi:hypothetical protein
MQRIVKQIQQSSHGCITGAAVGPILKERTGWRATVESAGGVKRFCLAHRGSLNYVVDGGAGKIYVASGATCSFAAGAKVAVRSGREPSAGWGNVFPWSVGTVCGVKPDGTIMADFPEQSGWLGKETDLEAAQGKVSHPVTCDIGTEDPSFPHFGFVRNLSGGKFEFTGNTHTKTEHKEYGFVRAGQTLSPSQPYFELRIIASTEAGTAIGLAGTSFFAGSMPGRCLSSIGFQSDTGKLSVGDGNDGTSFGRASVVGDTIGCGLLFEGGVPKTVYFTQNGSIVGRYPLRSEVADAIYPVVASGSPAVVVIDLKAKSPPIAMACSLEGFELEAKYDVKSQKWKKITKMGLANYKGEIPVTFPKVGFLAALQPPLLSKTHTLC